MGREDADEESEGSSGADRSEPAPRDIEEFLELLPQLGPAKLLAISAGYEHADHARRDTARKAAVLAAKRRGLGGELERLEGTIIQWANSSITRTATFVGVRPDLVLADIRMQAVAPLVDAAAALLLDDALSDANRAPLLEPLTAAIGYVAQLPVTPGTARSP